MGGSGAVVGATKSVEEMMVGAGIVIGCGEGLLRDRAARDSLSGGETGLNRSIAGNGIFRTK